jgi:dTDP-4-amino-4,6-dideoxygalactose transaminase
LQQHIYYSHNFGHSGPHDFFGLGINAKISELQAAMGLAVLPHMEEILKARIQVVAYYDNHLDFTTLKKITIREETAWNYSYYPVIFPSEEQMLNVLERLNEADIFPRRYFYPSLNTIEYTQGMEMPVSEETSGRILCLPLYADLITSEMNNIVELINENTKDNIDQSIKI